VNTGESRDRPADRPGTSGRGAKAGPEPGVQRTGPREVEFEEVLAWGSGDDSVPDRKTWRPDLALRLATGVGAVVAVAAVALGAANHSPWPVSDDGGARPAATEEETGGILGPNRQPSCLVDWPNKQHVPCPLSLPKVAESEPDRYHPNPLYVPR
jgi:hypothetical protein